MALQKSIQFKSTGIVCTYWRISNFQYFIDTGAGYLTLSGYVDKAARDAGKDPIFDKMITFRNNRYPVTRENLIDGTALAACYNLLKAGCTESMDFKDATDI